jgi:hypothetical protein
MNPLDSYPEHQRIIGMQLRIWSQQKGGARGLLE